MSNDSQLQQAVLAELNWEPSVIAAHIGVAAHNGVVTLSGHVERFAEKNTAEIATRRVRGVKAVAEEIEVRLPIDMMRDDVEIAQAVVDRLAWDAAIPSDAIKVKVEKGWVTLGGEVKHYYQKEAAESEVRSLYGVIGISNQVIIKPTVDVSNITDNIMHALHRTWFFDPQKVKVTAQDGNVKLTGNVHSLHDWQTASATAWSAPGTTAVQNDTVIDEEKNQFREFERSQEDRDAEEPKDGGRLA
jgi:osmotically-inducible protein OsmY